METNDKYIYLIYQEYRNELRTQDAEVLRDWLEQAEENRLLRADIITTLDATKGASPNFQVDVDAEYQRFQKNVEDRPTPRLSYQRFWWAAAVLLLAAGAWWLTRPTPTVEWQVVATNNNETRELILPDGSNITLNANSELRYPSDFAENNRLLEFKGEAFFAVAHRPEQPFVINVSGAEIKVLGTAFNVNQMLDSTVVSVVEGLVALNSTRYLNTIELAAGEAGSINHQSNQLNHFSKADRNATAWKSGLLEFLDTPLPNVFSRLEQHFNVQIEYSPENLRLCRYSFGPTDASLSSHFSNLEKIYQVRIIQVSDKHYRISGGIC